MSNNDLPLKEKLEEFGVDPDTWAEAGGNLAVSPFVQPQLDALRRLSGLLEGLEAQDQAKLKELRLQLARLQRGGGS